MEGRRMVVDSPNTFEMPVTRRAYQVWWAHRIRPPRRLLPRSPAPRSPPPLVLLRCLRHRTPPATATAAAAVAMASPPRASLDSLTSQDTLTSADSLTSRRRSARGCCGTWPEWTGRGRRPSHGGGRLPAGRRMGRPCPPTRQQSDARWSRGGPRTTASCCRRWRAVSLRTTTTTTTIATITVTSRWRQSGVIHTIDLFIDL